MCDLVFCACVRMVGGGRGKGRFRAPSAGERIKVALKEEKKKERCRLMKEWFAVCLKSLKLELVCLPERRHVVPAAAG